MKTIWILRYPSCASPLASCRLKMQYFGSVSYKSSQQLLSRSLRFSKDAKYLDWAIAVWIESVEIAEEDDPDLPVALSNLALAHEIRFDLNVDLNDISHAVQL